MGQHSQWGQPIKCHKREEAGVVHWMLMPVMTQWETGQVKRQETWISPYSALFLIQHHLVYFIRATQCESHVPFSGTQCIYTQPILVKLCHLNLITAPWHLNMVIILPKGGFCWYSTKKSILCSLISHVVLFWSVNPCNLHQTLMVICTQESKR